jgi:hypothetical protein
MHHPTKTGSISVNEELKREAGGRKTERIISL